MDSRLHMRFLLHQSGAHATSIRRWIANGSRLVSHVSLRITLLTISYLLVAQASPVVLGQELNYAQSGKPDPPGLELLQQEPHDIIYLTEQSGGGWVKTRLLEIPGRRMPAQPTGSLVFQIVDVEQEQYTVKWSEVESIDFWEQRLERETKERIAKADFKGAYPFLSVLSRDYPSRPGIRQLRSEFLWTDAVTRAKRGEREFRSRPQAAAHTRDQR